MVLLFVLILMILIFIIFNFLSKKEEDYSHYTIRKDECEELNFKSTSSPNFVSLIDCEDNLISFTVEGEKVVSFKKILYISENISVSKPDNGIKIFTKK